MDKALGKVFSKKNPEILCRVPGLAHSAKYFFKKNFAECLGRGTRQSIKKKNFAECLGSGTRQRIFLKIQKFFAECLGWDTRQSNFFKKINK